VNANVITVISSLPAGISPVPAVGFVLQLVGLFSAIGSFVALRRARERAARITAAWSALGLFCGIAVVAGRAVLLAVS
jgi:hypothetical protein